MGLSIVQKMLGRGKGGKSIRRWSRLLTEEPSKDAYLPTQRTLLVSLAAVLVAFLLLVVFLGWYLALLATASVSPAAVAQPPSARRPQMAIASPQRSGRFIHGDGKGEAPARVKVLTSCHPSAAHNGWSIKNKKLYAQLRGYDFEWWIREDAANTTATGGQGSLWPPIWNKTVMLLEALGLDPNHTDRQHRGCAYDWLLWMDCDSLVSRFDMTVEQIVGRHYSDHQKHLFLTRDKNGLNSGVMAMRCSEWNRDLWRRIWAEADQFRDHPWAEQKALHSLLDAEPQWRDGLAERPQAALQHLVPPVQAWHKAGGGGTTDGERAALYRHFVLHFAGATPEEKDRAMAHHYEAIMRHAPWMDPAYDRRLQA